MIESLRWQKGDAVAEKLIETNTKISNFLKDREILNLAGKKNMPGSKLFNSLVYGGDEVTINALKRSLPPDDFNKLKGTFLNKLKQNRSNIEGEIGFRSAFNELKRKESIVNSLFEKPEIQGFNELLDLGNAMGSRVLSSSGTSAAQVLRDVGGSLKDSILNESVLEGMIKKARDGTAKDIAKDKRVVDILKNSNFPNVHLVGDEAKEYFRENVNNLKSGRVGIIKGIQGAAIMDKENEKKKKQERRKRAFGE